MLPEIYVIRHGETEWNSQHRWQGALDSPLTRDGRAQARAMGRMLQARGIGPDTHRILSSPQGRARHTADLVFDGADIDTDDRLREIGVGGFAGLTRSEILARTGFSETVDYLELYAAAPGGEPFELLFDRVQDLLADLTGPTILVTHGITSRFLRTAALGRDMGQIRDLPGGQGVVYRISGGLHEALTPEPGL
ncbi:MAG: histidine phosphatase family protein [Pseudomonadota bacterium]